MKITPSLLGMEIMTKGLYSAQVVFNIQLVLTENHLKHISFDLDSTLIPNGLEFEVEKPPRLCSWLGLEPIRKGAPGLIAHLKSAGHSIHIYTTSFRSPFRIRLNLAMYGIKVGRIVNQKQNLQTLKSINGYPSKYPPAFDFNLHVDDSMGVGIEARRHDFNAIIVEPSDKNWTETVKNEITTLKEGSF